MRFNSSAHLDGEFLIEEVTVVVLIGGMFLGYVTVIVTISSS
jgi:hypothetical protein